MAYDVSAAKIAADVDMWITGRNAERNRAILKRRLIDGITFEALAEEFGLSVPQTKTIVYQCSSKLFRHVKYPLDK